MHSENPIGVFDSGVGGLSVLKHIHALLPAEKLLYVADSAFIPYGNKSATFIVQRALTITDFFITNKVKAVVVACNTATAAAIHELRAKYSLPIIGVEPAIKPAASLTKTGKVGVLATPGTLSSIKFQKLLAQFGTGIEIIIQPCNDWVDLIEAGELSGQRIRTAIATCLTPLISQGTDVLVLGCTHYPFLTPLLQEIAGPEVTLLDPGPAVAQELKKRLAHVQLLNSSLTAGAVSFKTTGSLSTFERMLQTLWNGEIVELDTLPAR